MTAQITEKLILEGQVLNMAFCPPLPMDSNQIAKVDDDEIQREIAEKKLPLVIFSTACWRRYIGTWEIREDKLYLVDVVGRYKKTNPDPLLANWFSGVLRIRKGPTLLPIHMGFASVHERELHIKLERGVVLKEREIDNSSKQFDRDKLARQNLPGGENRFDGDDL